MNDLRKIILRLLIDRGNSLSYYQLERKLKNLGNHHLIPELRNELIKLVNEDLAKIDKIKSSDIEYYMISPNGMKHLK